MRAPPTRFGGGRSRTLARVGAACVLLGALLISAFALLPESGTRARSADGERVASARVDRALAAITDEFRRGSIGSAEHPDGSPFSDGETDTGFRIRAVNGGGGARTRGDVVSYRLIRGPGTTEGNLVRQENSVQTIVAHAITGFTVSRRGSAFIFEVTADSGHTDARRRVASRVRRVMARNP